MNDPASYVGPKGEQYDLAGDLVREGPVAPDIMTSGGGENRCVGCRWHGSYGGCVHPYNLKEKQK